jgi:glycosyltransferase involved in cell wall biosynthesis
MSVGVPCVVSNIGTNKYIVQDGINGYLADTKKEWIEKISKLIEDGSLRKKIGLAGRMIVEEKYSLKACRDKYVNIFKDVFERKKK